MLRGLIFAITKEVRAETAPDTMTTLLAFAGALSLQRGQWCRTPAKWLGVKWSGVKWFGPMPRDLRIWRGERVDARADQAAILRRVIDLDQLRNLAADVRILIDASDDKAGALKSRSRTALRQALTVMRITDRDRAETMLWFANGARGHHGCSSSRLASCLSAMFPETTRHHPDRA